MATSITTPAELQAIADNLSGDYILENDIDMTGFAFTPIGDSLVGFSGTFDGQNFIISNLNLNGGLTSSYLGLFSKIEGGTVQNLKLNNVFNTSGDSRIGSLCGYLTGGTISNICSNNVDLVIGDIVGTDILGWIGGLIGLVSGETITVTNCKVNGTITMPAGSEVHDFFALGGMFGAFDAEIAGVISGCCADVNITVQSDVDLSDIGGFAGYISEFVDIDDCYALGDIIATISDSVADVTGVGGFIGVFSSLVGAIQNCYYVGSITISGTSNSVVGCAGFVGLVFGEEEQVIDCYAVTTFSCSDSDQVQGVAGFIGATFSGSATTPTCLRCFSSGTLLVEDCNDVFSIGGFNGESTFNLSFTDCFSTVDITGNNLGLTIAGGFSGEFTPFFDSYHIYRCYASGDVIIDSSEANSNVGGFIGLFIADPPTALVNCFSVGNVDAAGVTYIGSFIGLTDAYSIDDISNCWYLQDGAVEGVNLDEVSGVWSNLTNYNNTYRVFYSGVFYQSLQNGNLNNQPDISPLWWSVLPDPDVTAETTLSDFYSDAHAVYDQSGPDEWDFLAVWTERASALPDFDTPTPMTTCSCITSGATLVSVDGTDFCAYVSDGKVRKLVSTVTGLYHLEGMSVSVVADGTYIGEKTVTNGAITLDTPAGVIHVGLKYRGVLIPLNLIVAGQLQNSISFGKNVSALALVVANTVGVKYGTSLYNLQDIADRDSGQAATDPQVPFTGTIPLPNDDKWEEDKKICYVQDEPYPCKLNAMNVTIEVGEK